MTQIYKKIYYACPYIYNYKNKKCLTYDIIGTDYSYSASTGYDIATRLGTPNVTNFCNSLATDLA